MFNEIAVYEKKLDFQTALQKAKEYLDLYPEDKTVKKELAFLNTRVSSTDSASAESADTTSDSGVAEATDDTTEADNAESAQ